MEGDEGGPKRGRGRGKTTRATRARGRGRGRGRGRKTRVIESDEEGSPEQLQEEVESPEDKVEDAVPAPVAVPVAAVEEKENQIIPPTIDMEADISQLEAPTFTTITRGPPEPMLRLKWDHKVSLIGEKVLNPMIHCCDQCEKPILIYGRMIPCKHIFCLRCARSEPIKSCPRCKEKVIRVEQSGLGTVFMCTHGGSRYGNTGCRRTYLSQRDLQAHINHRHVTASTESKSTDAKTPVVAQRKTVVVSDPLPARQIGARPNQPFTSIVSSNLTNTPTTGRVNLVPIPIQELQQQSGQTLSTLSTPSSLLNALPHHQPPQTVATDLSAYFNQQQYGHGLTVSSYGSASQQSNSQQSQQFVPISLQQGQIMSGSGAISQQAGVHSMPPPVSSSSQFYAQYSQYNSMPSGQQNMHYSNARGNYEQASSNYQPNNAHGQSMQQQQQQQWQQNQYYR